MARSPIKARGPAFRKVARASLVCKGPGRCLRDAFSLWLVPQLWGHDLVTPAGHCPVRAPGGRPCRRLSPSLAASPSTSCGQERVSGSRRSSWGPRRKRRKRQLLGGPAFLCRVADANEGGTLWLSFCVSLKSQGIKMQIPVNKEVEAGLSSVFDRGQRHRALPDATGVQISPPMPGCSGGAWFAVGRGHRGHRATVRGHGGH